MGQKPRLDLRIAQRPTLSSGMRTGLELLALPATELRADLERQAQENPFLLVEPRPATDGTGGADLHAVAEPASLVRHLQEQIACMDLPAPVAALAAYLAADLDPRGLLPAPDAEIAAETGADTASVAAARAALQSCDPTGVAARDLGDCLRLQLIDAGEPPERAAAIHGQLRALAEGRFAEAAAALGCTEAEAERLSARLARFSPDPAAAFGAEAPRPLVPEVAVQVLPGPMLTVVLLDDPAAGLAVDEGLAARVRARGDPAERGFVATQLAAARRVQSAVGFRARTLLSVCRAMAEAQSAHFLGQARAPGPLSRAEIAARLGLHASTVGRAIRGRALLFEGAVRPLSYYFPGGLAEAGAGPAAGRVSTREIEARMRDILSAETAESVLSDEDLADYLRQAGVDIARRTVAKYRGCFSIPNSSERRRRLVRLARLEAGAPPRHGQSGRDEQRAGPPGRAGDQPEDE